MADHPSVARKTENVDFDMDDPVERYISEEERDLSVNNEEMDLDTLINGLVRIREAIQDKAKGRRYTAVHYNYSPTINVDFHETDVEYNARVQKYLVEHEERIKKNNAKKLLRLEKKAKELEEERQKIAAELQLLNEQAANG